MATNKKGVSESDTTNTTAESLNTAENTAENATENTEAATVETPPAKARYEGITNFAYIGPSLPGGRLKSLTVLGGTYAQITDYYKEAITLYPGVARLIVPVARLAEAREKTQTSGNLMYNYYQEIAATIKAKGEER